MFIRIVSSQGRWLDGGIDSGASLVDDTTFTVRGTYGAWTELGSGELNPVKALVQGRITFQGRLPPSVNLIEWLTWFGDLIRQIGTRFLDPSETRNSSSRHVAPAVR